MTYTCTRPGCEIKHEGQAYCPTCTAEIKQNLAEQRLAQGEAASCSCPPGTCHGGHTINMGMPRLTDDRLRQFRDDEYVCVTDDVRSMAAELLALRAGVIELEAEVRACDEAEESWSASRRGLETMLMEERHRVQVLAAQREPIGYQVLAKRTRTIVPRYTTAGGIWDEREPVDNHRAYCEDAAAADPERFGYDVEYIVVELQEPRPVTE